MTLYPIICYKNLRVCVCIVYYANPYSPSSQIKLVTAYINTLIVGSGHCYFNLIDNYWFLFQFSNTDFMLIISIFRHWF